MDVPFVRPTGIMDKFSKSRIMAILEGHSNSTETGAALPTQKHNTAPVMHLPIPSPHSVRPWARPEHSERTSARSSISGERDDLVKKPNRTGKRGYLFQLDVIEPFLFEARV